MKKLAALLACTVTLALASVSTAGTYAIATPIGVEIRTGGTPYPAGYLTVPPQILTRIRNGSLSASQLTPDGAGGVRVKTEDDLSLDGLKAVVLTEIDSKTETRMSQGFTVTISSNTYTFATRSYDQETANAIGRDLALTQLELPQKVRLVTPRANGSYSASLTTQAQVKAYLLRFRQHIQGHQQMGWSLKESLAAASDKTSVLAIRSQNNGR